MPFFLPPSPKRTHTDTHATPKQLLSDSVGTASQHRTPCKRESFSEEATHNLSYLCLRKHAGPDAD